MKKYVGSDCPETGNECEKTTIMLNMSLIKLKLLLLRISDLVKILASKVRAEIQNPYKCDPTKDTP
jgi:hypothetical protein